MAVEAVTVIASEHHFIMNIRASPIVSLVEYLRTQSTKLIVKIARELNESAYRILSSEIKRAANLPSIYENRKARY